MSIKKFILNSNLELDTLIFFALSIVLLLVTIFMRDIINDTIISILLLSFVIVFGLPHGALDTIIAKQFKIYKNTKEFIIFNFVYLLCAVFVFIIWNNLAIQSLYIFLLISGFHFSEDWKNSGLKKIERIVVGFSLLNLPLLFHEENVYSIFSFITNNYFLDEYIKLHKNIAYLNTLLLIVLIFKKLSNFNIFIQLSLILFFSVIFKPILFFLSYFCFFHSLKNYKDTINLLEKPIQKNVRKVVLLNTIATSFIGIVIYIIFFKEFSFKNISTIVFIGLASLTVPHMILRFIIERKK